MTNAITVRAANKHYGDFAALDGLSALALVNDSARDVS